MTHFGEAKCAYHTRAAASVHMNKLRSKHHQPGAKRKLSNKKMKKIPTLILLITVITALSMPLWGDFALAQVTLQPDLRPTNAVYIPVAGSGQEGAANVGNIILQLIAGSLIYAAGPLAVLMITVGGFRYVISHGDQPQMEAAKKNITWAVIGLIVIMISWIIVSNIIKLITVTIVN